MRSYRGQHTDGTNYRSDVSNDGFINASDVHLVTQQQGTSLRIVNGSFETPDALTFITVYAGETTISPLVVGLVSVDVAHVDNGGVVGPAFDGTQVPRP